MLYKSILSVMLLALLYGCGNGGGVNAGHLTFKASSVFREGISGCQEAGGVIINARLANQSVQDGTRETVCGTRLNKPKKAKIVNKETNATFNYMLNVVDDSEEIEKFCLKDEDNNSYLGIYVTGKMLNSDGAEVSTPFHENTICLTGPKQGDSSDNDTDVGDNTTTPDDNGTAPDQDPGTVIITGTPILQSYTFTGKKNLSPPQFPAVGSRTEIKLGNIGEKSIFVQQRGAPGPAPITLTNSSGVEDQSVIQIADPYGCAPQAPTIKELKNGDTCSILLTFAAAPPTDKAVYTLRVNFADGTYATSRIGVTKHSEGFYELVSTSGDAPAIDVNKYLPSTAVIKNNIYLFITSNIVSLKNELYSFNIETNIWTKIEIPSEVSQTQRHSTAMAAIGYNIYFFGNTNNVTPNETNDFFMYNTKTKVWKKLEVKPSNLISSRYGATMTAVGTRLYLFGGMDNDISPVNDNNLYFYDAITEEWDRVATNVPISSRGYMSATLGNVYSVNSKKIYYFGGITKDASTGKQILDTKIYSFDLWNLLWETTVSKTALAEYTVPTNRFSMLLSPRFIIFTGGRNKSGNESQTAYAVELSNISSAAWPSTTWTHLQTIFSFFDFKNSVSVSINGMNYIFKFGNNGSDLKVYAYYPGDKIQ